MKFANLVMPGITYKNMGEDMMIFAIFNLYAHMGISRDQVVRIPVSELRNYDGEDVLLPLNYPFYGSFRLSPRIHPVFIAISALHPSVIDSMGLREYGSIGCRDLYTWKMLKNAGVDAYMNGCMTIALPRQERPDKRHKTFFVDMPDSLRSYIPSDLLQDAEFTTQNYFGEDAKSVTEEYTMNRYQQYIREAALVVTSRLHCAMPCAAAGIPTILAMEKKSFRYNWVENIMPVYTKADFGHIDWAPQPLEFEQQKKVLLDHAASRVWCEYHRLVSRPRFEEWYNNERTDFSPESTRNVIDYCARNWRKDGRAEYIIWGVTQTAELIYDYIQKEYPKAKLAGVVDAGCERPFHGVMPERGPELFQRKKDAVVFVTPESANDPANHLFAEIGRKNYVLCWTNPKTEKKL